MEYTVPFGIVGKSIVAYIFQARVEHIPPGGQIDVGHPIALAVFARIRPGLVAVGKNTAVPGIVIWENHIKAAEFNGNLR